MHKQDHTGANIRFYEKEGLIALRRNDDNNYREYPVENHVLKGTRFHGIVLFFGKRLKNVLSYFDFTSLQSWLYTASFSSPRNLKVSQLIKSCGSGNAILLSLIQSSSMSLRPSEFGIE